MRRLVGQKAYKETMAKQDQDPNDDLDTQGIPDLDAAPGPRGRARSSELAEDEDLDSEGQPDLIGALHQKEMTGDAHEGGYPSAEEAAMHIVDNAPGAVDTKIDSYTGDPVEELE